ncbi:MAG: hypothetical protein LC789_14365 [Actinobacteria bacterium]|nr:hypothetical protein [Actinomycetota bacterium]
MDRPAVAVDSADRVHVSWTRSAGSSAECKATPAVSFVEVATEGQAEALLPAGAGYGSALAAGPSGVAVVRRDRAGKGSLQVSLLGPFGSARESLKISPAPAPSLRTPGIGGVVLDAPSLTADRAGSLTVAFVQGGRTPGTRVFSEASGVWTEQPPLGGPALAPTVVVDQRAGLLLARAVRRGAQLTVVLTRLDNGTWTVLHEGGAGRASAYREFGENLGLAAVCGSTLLAYPVLRQNDSVLRAVIAGQDSERPCSQGAPADSSSSPTTPRLERDATASGSSSGRGDGRGRALLGAIGLTAAAIAALRLRAVRRNASRRREQRAGVGRPRA